MSTASALLVTLLSTSFLAQAVLALADFLALCGRSSRARTADTVAI